MTFTSPSPFEALVDRGDCHATLTRLIGNLGGFFYRRRDDPQWTMDFVSAGCRDITGYDPHRFLANASIAFGELVIRADRARVNERVRLAVLHRQRATVRYRLRTAYGAWVEVEDRFTPVVDSAGKVIAIEGIIDRAKSFSGPAAFFDDTPASEPRHA